MGLGGLEHILRDGGRHVFHVQLLFRHLLHPEGCPLIAALDFKALSLQVQSSGLGAGMVVLGVEAPRVVLCSDQIKSAAKHRNQEQNIDPCHASAPVGLESFCATRMMAERADFF